MEQTNPLVFEIRLTAGELWRFSLYHTNKGMLGIFNILFTLAALFLLVTTWESNQLPYRVLLIVCALMFTVWQPFTLYLKSKRQAKRPAISAPMTLSFSKEGIVVNQGGETMELTWDHIGRVDMTKSMIIIYMDRIHAYLLPKNCLAEREEQLRGLFREQLPPERRRKV